MIYIIDNGCGWDDHAIYFVETDFPHDVVQTCAALGGDEYEKHVVCGTAKNLIWLNEVIWRRYSLREYLQHIIHTDEQRARASTSGLPPKLLYAAGIA